MAGPPSDFRGTVSTALCWLAAVFAALQLIDGRFAVGQSSKRSNYIPSKGDRLELRRLGLILRGTVLYADQVQVLVKWDNGRSNSLRAGVEDLDVIYAEVSSHALVPT